jgi:hypothetical protein
MSNETPTPAADSAVGKERIELVKSNGIAQPRAGSKTRRVWEICDEISAAAGRPALRGEVMAQGAAEGMSGGTVATQYGKWLAFHNVSADALKAARQAEKPEAASAA